MIPKLRITIMKTAQGTGEYVQIMSDDSISVNVVLVAGEINVQDYRSRGPHIVEPLSGGSRSAKRKT